MTAHIPIALRRRSALERRALALMRGEAHAFQDSDDKPAWELTRQAAKSQALFFAELRRVAALHGLVVQPPGSRLVGQGELTLLAWIAQEQRVTSQGRAIPADPLLIAAIARCAGLLDALGVHLGPHTLYGARLRGLAPTDNETSEQEQATRRIAATIA
ncbi:hypothetical protein [Sphingobium yanoikuyae]|uniref:hypothetical protein n=1 Tax=Sphingobium yanoikuyae TaxID=13690 RepID=UPI00068C02AD|nr:hypothetical protein [Sphingobium yanoikuyae]MDV3480100.1 hypothetical protein [Sphingobium yanoikuyae]